MSVSTPEAEIVAGSSGLTYELLPAMDVASLILRDGYKAKFHEDNQAMIRVVKTGRNPTMRHLNRVHRVSVASMHQTCTGPRVELFYEKSAEMAADIYTKAFTSPVKWASAIGLIGIYTPKQLLSYGVTYCKRSL